MKEIKTNEEIKHSLELCQGRFLNNINMCEKCPYREYGCACISKRNEDLINHFENLKQIKDAIPTVAKVGEKVGTEKAWEIARSIFLVGRPNGISDRDFQGIFNGKSKEEVFKMDFKDVLRKIEIFEDVVRRYDYARTYIVPGVIVKHDGVKKLVTCVKDSGKEIIIHAMSLEGETTTFPYDMTVQVTGTRVDVGMLLQLLK